MAWPTPQDFREAVQSPRLAFSDTELQAGVPELDRLGLPRPWSGAFATVYRLRCAGRSWAVRCFLHPLSDEQERYAAISATLASLKLPALVDCRFVVNGVRVGARWYPILKMEWVEGESLNHFVERHLTQPAVLLDLAGRWMRMADQLRHASLAHGDLQHGNVLVAGRELRLVDYDGMYVPALAGRISRELGHRNFQHPRRSQRDFGPWLDHFSAWVVYVSLLALAADPGLWQRFKGGDECLLFRADDFRRPDQSELYRALDRSPDRRLRQTVALFKSLLYLPPSQVPPLNGQMLPAATAVTVPPPALGGWISDHVPSARPPGTRPGPGSRPVSSNLPSWMQDVVAEGQKGRAPAGFQMPVWPERLLVLLGAAAEVAPWFWGRPLPAVELAAVDGVLTAALLGWLALRYRREPARQRRLRLLQDLARAQTAVQQVEESLRVCQQKREEQQNQLEAEQEQFDLSLRQLRERLRVEEDQIRSRLGEAVAELNLQRQQLRQQEAAEMQRLMAEAAQRTAAWQRNEFASEQEELRHTLQMRQQQHQQAFLRRHLIRPESIPGLDRTHVQRLRQAGITTAADVDERVLSLAGLGEPRTRRLLTWRRNLDWPASKGMPRALTDEEIAAVQRQRESRLRFQEAQRQHERQRQQQEKQRLEERFQRQRDQIDEQERRLRSSAEQESRALQQRQQQRQRDIESDRQARRREAERRLEELDREAETLGRSSFGLYWRIDDLQRQQESSQPIRFSTYLRRIPGFLRR